MSLRLPGEVNPVFAAWKMKPLNNSKWLTLATNLMCMLTRGAYPPDLQDNLQQLTKFNTEMYAVNWFVI